MIRTLILPYDRTSISVRQLSEATGWLRMKREGTNAIPSQTVIVNWGNGTIPPGKWVKVINASTAAARNKLRAYLTFVKYGIPTVDFTTDYVQANRWLKDGERVFARTTLHGRAGKGIVNLKGTDLTVPEAPVYTRYQEKKLEYRVHVCDGKVICVQQKRLRNGYKPKNPHVRSHKDGWIFCIHNVDPPPEKMNSVAIKAVKALGLDFGGVDVIVTHDKKCFVLEVNTAPGLCNSTIGKYANALQALV